MRFLLRPSTHAFRGLLDFALRALLVSFDCIVVKCHQDKRVINKSIYLALAINAEGKKELLGLWIAETEGAKFWLSVLTELNNRGVKDIFIACVDGLSGFPEAINAVFPKTKIQLCIVHLIRHSLRYVPHKDMKAVVATHSIEFEGRFS
jgi:transposase-like protein